MQDVNLEYDVNELAVYDPTAPYQYLTAWSSETGKSAYKYYGIYCPAVTSATVARLYGVTYVLEPAGARPPTGMIPDGMAGFDSDLYLVPGSSRATTTSLTPQGGMPPENAPGTPAEVMMGDSTWDVVTDSTTPAVLRLRLTDEPGWHASIDGRPLTLERFAGIMLQARVPAGRHRIVLRYWPTSFSLGIALAGSTVVLLVLAPLVGRVRRTRHRAAPAT